MLNELTTHGTRMTGNRVVLGAHLSTRLEGCACSASKDKSDQQGAAEQALAS
jgi:hypothetical protein